MRVIHSVIKDKQIMEAKQVKNQHRNIRKMAFQNMLEAYRKNESTIQLHTHAHKKLKK
jgi:oligoendopeptidase F